MCVRKCSQIVGPCLLVLGTLAVAANILLLFPGGTSKYLLEGHISKHAKAVPAAFSFPQVLLAATHITALGWQCSGCSGCATRPNAFISAVLSKLALLGAAACFIFSGVGLTNGPLCFYNTSEHGALWDYPFLDSGSQEPDARAENYLYNRHTWSICLEPEGIVAWNVVLFSLLLLVSMAEMVLASIQILNGFLGCLCGFCEGK
ncbi:PREDICTED: transmembrane 4 L6 family member 1-like [Acanthisitta chloris]|uniref:transmembrane 4 L6 family member 1-like n=1 Tax=Acanthisitta chloris TaxID=57068 RepID=UPI0004F0E61D|nr:PREDICTED: transmembrane 4 L6 family member 1-like [Acanthisitta chloris]